MDSIVWQIEEERLFFIALDELQRFGCEAVAEKFTGRPVGQRRNFVRREIARRLAFVAARDVEVEALLVGPAGFGAEVPLADAGRGVACGFEGLGHIRDVGRELQGPVRHAQFGEGALVSGDPVGDMQPRRVLSGHDACARGRTDRAGRIGVGEAHALRGEAVDVRRLVVRAAEAAEVSPAHVVGENEDDVGFGDGFGCRCRKGHC